MQYSLCLPGLWQGALPMRCYISLNITLQVSFSFHPLFLSFFGAFCHGLPCAFWHTKPVRSSTAFWWVSSDVRPCIHSESQMCNNFSTSPGMFLHKLSTPLYGWPPLGPHILDITIYYFIVMKWMRRYSLKMMVFSDDSHELRTFQAYKFVV